MTRRFLPLALFFAFTLAAFGAIRSYDFFWQLATGKWIVEHRALPLNDPFTLASAKTEWIDGEWLYEIALYGAHSLVGLAGLSWVKGLLAATIFTIAFVATRRESESALLISAVAFAGAMPLLDLRPSTVAALMVVLMLAARPLWLRVVIAIVWMNVHPSALLAPIVAGASTPSDKSFRTRALHAVACALALLVNPHGWKAIAAPIELTAFVQSGVFVNAEWLPSSPLRFPILYVAILVAIVSFVVEERRDWWRIALLAMFTILAVRHVRNQPLFFAAFAMLVRLPRIRPAIEYAAAAIAILLIALTTDHRLGVPPERFPIAAVARLQAMGIRGNIYNADQFGGFLIWTFHPPRRVLTDGRNELYREFIPEWQQAREHQGKWVALLRKYRIDIAVEEYRPPLRVTDLSKGTVTEMPADHVYWPRSEWVMVARDEAAMVFVRKSALSSRARADR